MNLPALLIIDVQQALCVGEYGAFEASRVIANINQVAQRFRATGRPVLLIQHASSGGVLDHGSPGWQLAEGLAVADTDLRLDKRATDSFHQTDLQARLQALGVTELVICGLQSEFCVDTTTRRALALGYPVRLVSDGHSTMDSAVLSAAQISAHENETLRHITSFGPRVTLCAAAELQP